MSMYWVNGGHIEGVYGESATYIHDSTVYKHLYSISVYLAHLHCTRWSIWCHASKYPGYATTVVVLLLNHSYHRYLYQRSNELLSNHLVTCSWDLQMAACTSLIAELVSITHSNEVLWHAFAMRSTVCSCSSHCTNLATEFLTKQDVPCCQVPVDKPSPWEVPHTLSNLLAEGQQLLWQTFISNGARAGREEELVKMQQNIYSMHGGSSASLCW